MNKILKRSLIVAFGFGLLMLVTSEGYGNTVFISLVVILISYIIFKTIYGWKNKSQKMWSSSSGKTIVQQPKILDLPNDPKNEELPRVPFTTAEKKLQLLFDVLTIIYLLIFGFLLFDILQPLYGSGQAQNGMQAMLLLIPAVPISGILIIVSIYLGIQKFSKKIPVNIQLWQNLLSTFFLPAVLISLSIAVILGVSEPMYHNKPFYDFARNSAVEPFVRAAIIVALLAFIRIRPFIRTIIVAFLLSFVGLGIFIGPILAVILLAYINKERTSKILMRIKSFV